MHRTFAVVATLLSFVSFLSLLALAQEPKQLAKPATQKKATDQKAETPPPVVVVRSQLPKGWRSLNLSDKQKKAIYSTRAQFAAKRQALLEQIEKLKDEEMEALNKLLTDAQRQQLATLKK